MPYNRLELEALDWFMESEYLFNCPDNLSTMMVIT